MKKIDITDWSHDQVKELLDGVLPKCEHGKGEALFTLIHFYKDKVEGDPDIEKGEDFTIEVSKGLGDTHMILIEGIKGEDEFNFEFDYPSFEEIGYGIEDIFEATLALEEGMNKEFETITDEETMAVADKLKDTLAEVFEEIGYEFEYQIGLKRVGDTFAVKVFYDGGEWGIIQHEDNGQDIMLTEASFVPYEVMEIANELRWATANDKFGFVFEFLRNKSK